MPNLMWLFVIPFIASFIIFLFPPIPGRIFKRLAVALSLIPLAFLIYGQTSWIGSQIIYQWIPKLSINFHLSIDSLSFVFLCLTAVIIPISLLAVQSKKLVFPNVFYGLVLLLQGLLFGFFMARDLAVFTFFWEAMLLPLYFIITLWGGPEKQKAAFKFIVYMIAGSALMVAAVLALYLVSGSFNMESLQKIASSIPHAGWIFGIFLLAFCVKTPLFPFHAWLPDTYCQAPTSGTILLSALLSKAGIYGILRIGMELFPEHMKEWSPLLLGLAIVGVFYGGLAAWRQNDFKRLLAYSSFSHVNFILVGLFVWNQTSHSGAILQALNHGITIAGLFLVAGWLENRLGSTSMNSFKGLAKYFPQLCWLTLIFVLSSVALPGTNNFVGELMILFGLFSQNVWLASVLGLTVILSVIYMLRWMQHVYFEKPSPKQPHWIDINVKDLIVASPLVILIFWIGLYPSPLLQVIELAAQKIVAVAELEEIR